MQSCKTTQLDFFEIYNLSVTSNFIDYLGANYVLNKKIDTIYTANKDIQLKIQRLTNSKNLNVYFLYQQTPIKSLQRSDLRISQSCSRINENSQWIQNIISYNTAEMQQEKLQICVNVLNNADFRAQFYYYWYIRCLVNQPNSFDSCVSLFQKKFFHVACFDVVERKQIDKKQIKICI